MARWLTQVLGLGGLPRTDDLDDRATVAVLFGRFTDELGAGLLVVLTPTFRARLGLSVVQVGGLLQALYSVAAVVEPIAGVAIDMVRRRPLLVWGALGWAAALLLAACAPSFGWLLAAFCLVGVASGPLAHTADVVLVEGHPGAVERITTRSGQLDTVGALLGPAAVAVAGLAGIDTRVLLVFAGVVTVGYAVVLATSVIPPPPRSGQGAQAPGSGGPAPVVRQAAENLLVVVRDRTARLWLLALVVNEVLGLSELFEPVWLRDVVGASQSLVAVHVVLAMLGTLAGLTLTDRLLRRHPPGRLLVGACVAGVVLYPAWLYAPGVAGRLLLVGPRNLVLAPLWPILRSRSLAALPGAGGATSAWYSLLGLLPLQLGFAWVAARIGLTTSLLAVHLGATVVLLALVRRLGPAAMSPPETDGPN